MTTYIAVARPDPERGWLIRIRGLGSYPDEGLPTWARNLAEVEAMASDLIAVYLDVPEDSFGVEIRVELPAAVQEHLRRAAELRDRAVHAQAEAADEYRSAARELKAGGLTVRDIGAALGVSHQRAQQLASANVD
jgi:hypothetical protein